MNGLMAIFPNILTRRLAWALMFSFIAFILWFVPSFIVMSPDSNYAQRLVREAELVAAAIAQGGMARKPTSRIGANPNDPRILEARARSPFNRRRAEQIVRQMSAIIHKRIVLYDHRRRIFMDSYNFNQAEKINVEKLPDLMIAAPSPAERIEPPDYLPPPSGDHAFVRTALLGQSATRQIFLTQNEVDEKNRFHPKQIITQAAAPIRRLKLVQGAVVLIDEIPEEYASRRWRSLFDSAPVFAAALVSLLLLLLWLQGRMISPLSKLAYSAETTKTKRNDEIRMISQRQYAGQIAAQNFAETTQNFAALRHRPVSRQAQQKITDSEMAAKIHDALISAKMEMVDLTQIVQRCVHRHNARLRKETYRKMAGGESAAHLPSEDGVRLDKVETSGMRNAFSLLIFARALEFAIDYFIQSAAAAQPAGWPAAVRIALTRQKKTIQLMIEDGGEDIAAHDIASWIIRAYDSSSAPLQTLRAIETVLAMHHGQAIISSLRPPQLTITLPISPSEADI